MKPKTGRRKPKSLVSNSRWAAYATAGAATAFACAETAEASIHHVVSGQTFGGGSSSVIKTFALDQPGDKFSLAWGPVGLYSAGFAAFRAQALVSTHFVGNAYGPYRYPFKLASGQAIAGGPFVQKNGPYRFGTLAISGGKYSSHWLGGPGTTGFVGFEFNGGAGAQYAWARILLDTGPNKNYFTLVDYAWGDPGDIFNAGDLTPAVPEPATIGLLALGAVGVTALRKRRAKTAA
jgi:hypothetical protein